MAGSRPARTYALSVAALALAGAALLRPLVMVGAQGGVPQRRPLFDGAVLLTPVLPPDSPLQGSMQAKSASPAQVASASPAFATGSSVTVKQEFMSLEEVKLPNGLPGRVVLLDKDGDALIRFDGIEVSKWVLSSSFDKLKKMEKETISVGGVTLRTLPLLEESTENVSLGASTVASVAGCLVPVVGGFAFSALVSAAWAAAASKSISPQLEEGGQAHELAREAERAASVQGKTMVQMWNHAAEGINRSH